VPEGRERVKVWQRIEFNGLEILVRKNENHIMSEQIFDYLRITLYAILMALGFMLYQAWERDFPAPSASAATTSESTPATTSDGRFVPTVNTPAPAATPLQQPVVPSNTAAPSQLVTVTTDTLQVTIDTRGGDIIGVKLLKYPESLENKTPIVLFNDEPKTRYLAQSGLLSAFGPDTSKEEALYTTPQTSYTLAPTEKDLVVKLHWQKDGVQVTKLFTFTRDNYEIKVGYGINNQSSQPWSGHLYTQLLRTDAPPANQGGIINSFATYFGAAVSSPQKPMEKISFDDMREANLNQTIQNGWVAMIQHYFISAWIPPKDSTSTYYSRVMPTGLYTIGMIGPTLTAAPGTQLSTEAKLYVGPAIADLLEKTAPKLDLTIDYGWFWFIGIGLFWLLQKIYDVVGNWGWSIVIVTIIVKLLFYQLSNKSYRSMSGMKKLQPKIEMLKERYGDDKQKLTQATLDLYRQEKVNPMSGCLPILVQIPVFIALYWVLVESVQLRQAPFIFWIHDLAQKDPYYILPILMGIAMFFQQRLNPPPPDPMQAKVLMVLPVVFTVLFADFPAGLLLYWFVNSVVSFLQQWYIMHKMEKETRVVPAT
jgi:YidC/Oxa1 family membrane protein insertase